jgi:CRP-like cAMP-binding protein
MPDAPYRNTLLRHLDGPTLKRLDPTHIMLELRRELQSPDHDLDCLYFVEEGIVSMTTIFKDGTEVEVGTFGYESVIGSCALMGGVTEPNRVFVQIPGHGFMVPLRVARTEFDRHGEFHSLILRHVQAHFDQCKQNAACNAVHRHEQRLARWLMVCSDRISRDTLDLSHEFLAHMLGSTRSTVTLAAGILKKKGLIDYRRGSIRILHPELLKKHACECYGVIHTQLRELCEYRHSTGC